MDVLLRYSTEGKDNVEIEKERKRNGNAQLVYRLCLRSLCVAVGCSMPRLDAIKQNSQKKNNDSRCPIKNRIPIRDM